MASQLSKRFFIGKFTDKHYQRSLETFRRVQQFRKDHPSATQKEACDYFGKEAHDKLSKNTISKYWERSSEPVPSCFIVSESVRKVLRGAVSKVAAKDSDILNIILKIYLPGQEKFDCDLTFAKGDFYGTAEVSYPKKCFDKYPEESPYLDAPTIYCLDDISNPCSEGYIENHTLSSIIIDLPQAISDTGVGNASTFKNLTDFATSYYRMLRIADQKLRYASILNQGGLLIIKVGDIIHKGKTIWLSQIVAELASGEYTDLSKDFRSKLSDAKPFDFELVDKFVHCYSPEEIANVNPRGRSVKAHDYFLVFRKKRNPVEIIYTISPQANGNGVTVAYTLKETAEKKAEKFRKAEIHVEELRIKSMTPQNTIRLKGPVRNSVMSRIRNVYDNAIPFEAKLSGSHLVNFLNEGSVRLKSNERPIKIGKNGKKKYKPRPAPFQIKEHTCEILTKAGIYYIENNMTSNELDTEIFIISPDAVERVKVDDVEHHVKDNDKTE